MPLVLPLPLSPFSLLKILKPLQFISMAAQSPTNSPQTQIEKPPINLENYPSPLSPPLPAISKNIELNRALTASSKSALFSIDKEHVLFEDEWIIAVNKPQGIYCEAILTAANKLINNGGKSNSGDQETKPPELHLANRLDRDTSGVTIITKSHKVAAKLVKAFTQHTIKKTYIALCVGKSPNFENITIKSGHGRSKHGAWRVYSLSNVGRTLPGGSYVRDMETSFKIISVNGSRELLEKHEENNIFVEEKSNILSDVDKVEVLVRAYPMSGRTHQIRLHCQYLGIPIRGDVKYEGVCEWKDKNFEGHELHAESLDFEHPVTGRPVLIRAPLPMWASRALEESSS